VGGPTHVVRIPAHVVDDALQTVPNVVRRQGRDGSVIEVEGNNHYHGTSSRMTRILDCGATGLRNSTKADCANFARIADALPRIAFASPAVHASDVPQSVAALHGYEASLTNTSKHCLATPQNLQEAQAWTDLA